MGMRSERDVATIVCAFRGSVKKFINLLFKLLVMQIKSTWFRHPALGKRLREKHQPRMFYLWISVNWMLRGACYPWMNCLSSHHRLRAKILLLLLCLILFRLILISCLILKFYMNQSPFFLPGQAGSLALQAKLQGQLLHPSVQHL